MERQSLLPDGITYTAFITACEDGRQSERAWAAFHAMQRQRVVPC